VPDSGSVSGALVRGASVAASSAHNRAPASVLFATTYTVASSRLIAGAAFVAGRVIAASPDACAAGTHTALPSAPSRANPPTSPAGCAPVTVKPK
jgi:hypothetical protein